MGDSSLPGLANDVENSDNFTQENKGEVYTAPNGMRINISDQEGATDVVNSLRGATISRGENTVPQQPPHGEENPKYKSMGGDRPSLPTAPGESFNDKDYRNPDNRNNSNYGPKETTPKMTDALGNIDARAKELRGDEVKKDLTKETPEKPFFDLEFGSDEGEEKKPRDLHQEALDSNKKTNEGFVSGPVLSNTGKAFFDREDIYAENAKLKEDLEALKQQVAELSKKFDDPDALQNALDPNRPKSEDQLEVDQAYATINKDLNQKALNEMDQIKAMLEPKTPPVTPEVTPITPEITTTPEEQKKQRDFKTAALIAGIVAGGAAGILGGAAVGVPVAAAAGVVSIGGRITNYFLGRSLVTIGTQLKDPTLDEATRERLQRREGNLRRIQNVVQHVTKFATGAALGAGISSFISNVAMGGHGLVWNRPEVPGGLPGVNPETGMGKTGFEKPVGGGETPLPASPETYSGNSFIHDGRVDLPGSAWDGNMAAGPAQDTLAGGAGNFANYAGGPSEMAASQLGQDLASNNITDQLLTNLTTYDKHRLLTEYWSAIRSGNANPELIQTLKSMNTEGAQKLLAAIGK